jgi:DNA-binding transcriptional MerR regulator
MNLEEYREAAPFKVGELLAALDRLLGKGTISIRTLRYYGAVGVMPRPLGAPKFARYGYEHLLSILAAKMLQDRGMKLESIVDALAPIREGRFDSFEAEVETWLSGNVVREGLRGFGASSVPDRRIALTSICTIEIAADADLRPALEDADKALQELIRSLG